MPLITGQLTDFGFDAMAGHAPRITFRHISPGVAGAAIMATKPVVVTPEYNGYFEALLTATAAIAPAGYYTMTVEWTELPSRTRRVEGLPWKLYVPAEGGILGDLLRIPANPGLVFTGAEPPANPSPGSWWLDFDGMLNEFDGEGWNFKQNLRGPAGYNATTAAEDDAAIAAFIRQSAGPTATGAALSEAFERVVNLDHYAALDGIADDSAGLTEAIAVVDAQQGGRLLIPEGKTLYLNTPVYMNGAAGNFLYEITGEGRGSKIVLGAGLNGKFAVTVNETAAGAQILHVGLVRSRLVVRDVAIAAKDASVTSASWVKANGAGVRFEDVRFSGIKTGLLTKDYVDLITLRRIEWRTPAVDGWLYNPEFHGDGLVIDQVFATEGAGVASLTNVNGGTISNIIGGIYRLSRCHNIEVVAGHIEATDPAGGRPYFFVQSSHVVFRNTRFYGTDTGDPTIEIDDVIAGLAHSKSEVVFEDVSFTHYYNDGYVRAPDIKITAAADQTRLRFSRVQGWTTQIGAGYDMHNAGFRVVATDAGMQAAIDADPAALFGEVELVREGARGWVVRPIAGIRVLRTQAAPSTVITAGTEYAGTLVNGTTYYYRFAVRTPEGYSAPGAEQVRTATATGNTITYLGVDVPPATIAVWRGTAPGVYDSYTELPVNSRRTYIRDFGDRLSGYAWRTVVPALPAASTLQHGYEVAGQREVWAAAAPTAGTWKRGDITWNTGSAAITGWRCSSAGTPGTWTSFS